jgi:hypothetical protein
MFDFSGSRSALPALSAMSSKGLPEVRLQATVDDDGVGQHQVEPVGLLDHEHAGTPLPEEASSSPEVLSPDSLGISTSMNSRATTRPLSAAYSRRSFSCASMENPSRSCSLLDTRA